MSHVLFSGWDSSTEEMKAINEQIYVWNEDLIFRMEYRYHGRSPEMNIIIFEETDIVTNSNDNIGQNPWTLSSF